MILTLPAMVSLVMSGVTALRTTICEAIADGIESKRASRPSGEMILMPSNDSVVHDSGAPRRLMYRAWPWSR